MPFSLRTRLERPLSAALARSGRFANRVGNKLARMSVSAAPWDRVGSGSARESAVERAARLGYVVHGEFKLKLAYDENVLSEQVIETIERGGYERFEGRRSREFVVAGDRVIELGAGLGFLSALIMSTTDVADFQLVEADPRLASVIRRTHALNNVNGPSTIHSCVATCDAELIDAGEVDFHVGAKFCASSIMGARKRKNTVKVPVVSLPDLISEHDSNVLLLDIEGAETGIFNGTPLGSIERIIMEIHPHRIGDQAVRDIFRHLDALGFVYDMTASAGGVVGFHRAA